MSTGSIKYTSTRRMPPPPAIFPKSAQRTSTTQTTSSTPKTPIGLQFSKERVGDSFYPDLALNNKTTDPLAEETGVVESSYTQLRNPAEVAGVLEKYANLAMYLANLPARERIASTVEKFNQDYGNMFQIT